MKVAIIIAHLLCKYTLLGCIIITPAVAKPPRKNLKALKVINTYRYPVTTP